jgi:hypothetical protein
MDVSGFIARNNVYKMKIHFEDDFYLPCELVVDPFVSLIGICASFDVPQRSRVGPVLETSRCITPVSHRFCIRRIATQSGGGGGGFGLNKNFI